MSREECRTDCTLPLAATLGELYEAFAEGVMPGEDENPAEAAITYDLGPDNSEDVVVPNIFAAYEGERLKPNELHTKNIALARQVEAGVLAWGALNGCFPVPESCRDDSGGLSQQGATELLALQRQGEDARTEMMAVNYPQAMRIAENYCKQTGMESEVAMSAAQLALLDVIGTYDYRKPHSRQRWPEADFAELARIRILSSIKRTFYDEGFAVTLPDDSGKLAEHWLGLARSGWHRLEQLYAEAGWAPQPLGDIVPWMQPALPLEKAVEAGVLIESDVLGQIIKNERLRLLGGIIGSLEPQARRMFLMSYAEFDFSEIGVAMGISDRITRRRVGALYQIITRTYKEKYGKEAFNRDESD